MSAQTVDRTKAPATPPLADYTLPPTQDGTLPNGLKVVLVEDPRYPMMEVRMGFAAGAKYEPAQMTGLAETVASLLKEGAGTRDARQYAEALADIGGDLNAASGMDSLTISGYVLSENAGKLLELLADMVQRPAFAEEELRLRKQNRVQELAAERSQASTLADEKFAEVLFPGHPYGRTLPTVESIGRISRADLLKFHQAHVIPNTGWLVMVGPLGNTKAIWRELETRFGKWEKKDAPAAPEAKFAAARRSVTLIDRPGSVQADVRLGRVTVPRMDPDYLPLAVGSTVLGGGTSSRLFVNFREKQGYAYNVGTHVSPYRDTAVLEGQTEVRNEVLGPAMESLLGEFRQMGAGRVTAKELGDVKNYLSGNFVMSLETPSGVANQLLSVRLNGLPNNYLETYVQRIRAVEPDQIQKAGSKYLDPANAAIVVVGDAKAIGKALEKLGEVKVEKAK